MNGSIGKAKKVNPYQMSHEENEFEVSSDGDAFEVQIKRQKSSTISR